jgi:hypothetical protein
MSRVIISKAEFFVRWILTIIVVFNAIIPTTVLAMSPGSGESTESQTSTASNSSSATEPVYYQS